MAETTGSSSAAGASKEKEGAPQVKELGLTQIDGHPKDHPFVADVVFVHGLQGHPQRTWQSKPSAKSHKTLGERLKSLRLSGKTRKAHEDDRFFWPAAMLPRDFADIRILTYGYDSRVTKTFTGPTSKNGIFEHGTSFLQALSRARVDCGGRPIIFVAHSLGGLLIKQALLEARKQANDRSFHNVYNNSYAVIFFGTPHRGSKVASWGLLLSTIVKVAQMDINDGILRDLDPESGSSKLKELVYDFDDVLRDSQRPKGLGVYSFQEELGMTGVSLLGGKVVPDESSSLDSRRYGSDFIHANHMGMCRFNDQNDDGYEKFKGILAKFITEIRSEQSSAVEASLENDAIRRAELLRSLDYAERRSREHQLQNLDAKEESLSIFFSNSSPFMKWLSNREGLVWISGKPGSGKSTLVNYLVNRDETKLELQRHSKLDWIVLHFFFDFRGGKDITNSFEGLLRSLLYQLVKQMPTTEIPDFDDGERDSFSSWPERRLRDALRTSFENAKKGVCIFVDGLDEYEGSVLKLIQVLQSLITHNDSQETSIKICVSSRPEPIPSQLLQNLPHVSISNHNESGIRSYCLLKFEELEPVTREDLDIWEVSRTIARVAEGVFLWARFALEEVIQGHFSGETREEISARLDSIPRDLEEVYDRMLCRMEPLAKKECRIMLQLVSVAKRKLFWHEHFVATEVAMDRDVVSCGDKVSISDPKFYMTFAKRLRAKAVGFLEPVNSQLTTKQESVGVVLIHRSVSTYLDRKGWQMLGESETYNLVQHESLLVKTCALYLHQLLRHCNMETTSNRSVWRKWYSKIFNGGQKEPCLEPDDFGIYPFLAYAAGFIFEHAKALEQQGTSSYPLLQGIMTEQLVRLHVLVQGPKKITMASCQVCAAPWTSRIERVIFEHFDPTLVGFLHGLASFCKSELAAKQPAPGQVFWGKALRCAIFFGFSNCERTQIETTQEVVSLALQSVATVQQEHIVDILLKGFPRFSILRLVELVLRHESVKNMRLTSNNGQPLGILWFYAMSKQNRSETCLTVLIETAKRRGEDMRQACGPDGNVVETLLKEIARPLSKKKLRLLREYYEMMSWPFEYDSEEIEMGSEDEASKKMGPLVRR